MSDVLIYEELVEKFNASLLTDLRGHSAGENYLESWVPDENPVLSILNMVEAVEMAGCPEIKIAFETNTMNEDDKSELLSQVGKIGQARIKKSGIRYILTVSEIGK